MDLKDLLSLLSRHFIRIVVICLLFKELVRQESVFRLFFQVKGQLLAVQEQLILLQPTHVSLRFFILFSTIVLLELPPTFFPI